jgi:hypothetical protein
MRNDMSSSIIVVYSKDTMTETIKKQLVEYSKNASIGLHFNQSNPLVQEVVNDMGINQNFFILSDAQNHETVEEILSWDWKKTKEVLIEHHRYLDEIRDILVSKNYDQFSFFISFDSFSYLSEYDNVINVESIADYIANIVVSKYVVPNPTKFKYIYNK